MVRFHFVLCGVVVSAASVFAQLPQTPVGAPRQLPPGVVSNLPAPVDSAMTAPVDLNVKLPQKEALHPIDAGKFFIWRQNDSWQIFADQKLFRDFGKNQPEAQEVRHLLQELQPTEWATIGSPRPVVEYGLTQGKPQQKSVKTRSSRAIDLKSVHAEQVKGAWVLRDENTVHLNFGANQADAEQAAAVVRKYGFNRIASVGKPTPLFSCFYAAPVQTGNSGQEDTTAKLMQLDSENRLTRTGIPVPGAGFIGERIAIDARKVEVRKERGEFVVAHGPDVLAHCGASEWSARDAMTTIKDCRFTEFCKVSDTGLTFFLVNGKVPTKVPFSVKGPRFNPNDLKVHALDGKFGIYSSGRQLFTAPTQEEADATIKLVQGYQFDMVCQVGLSSRPPLKFLAKYDDR